MYRRVIGALVAVFVVGQTTLIWQPLPAYALGKLNARVINNSIVASRSEDKKTLTVNFIVQAEYRGTIGNDPKGREDGSFTAKYDKDIKNVRLQYKVSDIGWVETFKTIQVYKVDKSSFKPAVVSDPDTDETTENNNNLWDTVSIIYVERTKSNVTGEPPRREDASPIILAVTKTPDNDQIGLTDLYSDQELADSVQQSLADRISQQSNRVTVSGSAPPTGGALNKVQASTLIDLYNLDNGESGAFSIFDSPEPLKNPPFTNFVPKSASSVKVLRFTFNKVFQSAGNLASDNYFFWFKAKDYTNLWLIIDIDGDAMVAIQDSPQTEIPFGNIIRGSFGGGSDAFQVNKDSFDSTLASRVFNVCDSADDCSNSKFTSFTNQPNTQSKFSLKNDEEIYNDAIAHTSNVKVPKTCNDKGEEGKGSKNCNTNSWMNKWGITYEAVSTDIGLGGNCSAGKLFADFATKGIGAVFKDMTQCLIDEIFKPAVKWAAELVVKAAGITYCPPGSKDRWRA